MKNENIEVKSLKLVKEIAENKGIVYLTHIKKDSDDPIERPIYCFQSRDNVKESVAAFFNTYGADDRSMDNWEGFNAQEFYRPTNDDTIITRNIYVVNKIIHASYGLNLCDVFKEPKGYKTAFRFIKNDEILKIKVDGDAESYRRYQEKTKQEENK